MQIVGKAPHVAIFSATVLEREIEAAGFAIIERARHGSKRKDARIFIVARKAGNPDEHSPPDKVSLCPKRAWAGFRCRRLESSLPQTACDLLSLWQHVIPPGWGGFVTDGATGLKAFRHARWRYPSPRAKSVCVRSSEIRIRVRGPIRSDA
jgi:hypothetical protein